MRRGVRSATRLGGYALAALSIVHLAALWMMFFRTGQKSLTAPMMLTLVPFLLGLFAVGCLIPALAEFKLPGLEAKLIPTQPGEALSKGPSGSSGGPGADLPFAGPAVR